jgi:hypothetical protein
MAQSAATGGRPVLKIGLDHFAWQRPVKRTKGFVWERHAWERDGSKQFLVPAPGAAFVDYEPKVELFRDFAALDRTPAAILKFANSYGALLPAPRTGNQHECVWSQELGYWREQVDAMKDLVGLVDILHSSDLQPHRNAFRRWPPRGPEHGKVLERLATSSDYNDLACAAAAPLVGAMIHLLRYDLDEKYTWDTRTKQAELHLVPHDLRAFMLLQLGRSLVGGWRLQRCPGCQRWFRLAPGVGRADKTMCSPSCRFKVYRLRKKRAVELRAKGRTVKQIAKALKADVDKVKKWIAMEK